ncbi:hypothetical protein EPH_0054840 [Eimeria praecox]|uniref:Uncharacterized protein n=1 Tax=Eimeria praecox TaxID=51316 RepID=U6GQW1_9EIME|nr:hypothetical protein EPH_0054840 [Eimeria praecox]
METAYERRSAPTDTVDVSIKTFTTEEMEVVEGRALRCYQQQEASRGWPGSLVRPIEFILKTASRFLARYGRPSFVEQEIERQADKLQKKEKFEPQHASFDRIGVGKVKKKGRRGAACIDLQQHNKITVYRIKLCMLQIDELL